MIVGMDAELSNSADFASCGVSVCSALGSIGVSGGDAGVEGAIDSGVGVSIISGSVGGKLGEGCSSTALGFLRRSNDSPWDDSFSSNLVGSNEGVSGVKAFGSGEISGF